MKCTKCGNEINEGAETCNHCGADLQGKPSNGSSCGKWVYIIVGLVLFFGYKMCSSDKSSVSSPNTELSEKSEIPDWIPGAWSAETPAGTINAIFTSSGVYKDDIDGSGTYYYDSQDKRVHTSTGSVYEVDFSSRRLGVGYGYWMYKK